jgi:hypothetical protein
MNNILKIVPILLLSLTLSCEQDDDNSRFSSDPTTGWVEFSTSTSGTTISIITEQLEIPVSVRVPVYENGLTITYSLQPVQGDFSSIVTTGNSIFVEPGQNGENGNTNLGNIVLNFNNVADLTEIVVFDVVLTGTDASGVQVGLGDNSITSYRISTPCPLDTDAISGTYDVDEVFTSGVNAGLSLAAAFGESYQVELTLDPTDLTQTRFILSNSPGFDQYFVNGTTASLDTCNGTVTYPATLNLGAFANMSVTSTSYTESPAVFVADGTLGNFGPYQFILTKQ